METEAEEENLDSCKERRKEESEDNLRLQLLVGWPHHGAQHRKGHSSRNTCWEHCCLYFTYSIPAALASLSLGFSLDHGKLDKEEWKGNK